MLRKMFGQLPWVKEAQDQVDCTPDMDKLETTTHARVFIYDDMMYGMRNHGFLWNTNALEYLGWGYSAIRFLAWIRKPSEVFALPSKEPELFKRNTPDPAMVRGEVYNIPSPFMPELDKFYQNMVRFNRTRIPVTVPYRKSRVTEGGNRFESHKERYLSLPCWMYVGEPRFWEKRIDVGYEYQPIKQFSITIHNQPRPCTAFTKAQMLTNTKAFDYTVDNEKLYQEYIAEIKKNSEQANSK